MKTPKWNTKHRPGLSRILKEAGAVRQAKPGHMHVLRACLKMSLLIGTELQEDQLQNFRRIRTSGASKPL